ncbi:MAG: hypothetical protein Q8P59_04810 [Dehalococcoidia bacterium]|nr:hypothetical protein [Dehalococcoidia bacterium]
MVSKEGEVMERTDDLEEIIEIRDPEINVAEIMARIRANLAKREPLVPEVDSLVFGPGLGGFLSLEEGLKQSLQQASFTYDKTYVGDQLRPTVTWKDQLLKPLRRSLHQLVRFYTDILSAKQVAFNSAAERALNALAEKLEREEKSRHEELECLKAEIAELRQMVDQLRCMAGGERDTSGQEEKEG